MQPGAPQKTSTGGFVGFRAVDDPPVASSLFEEDRDGYELTSALQCHSHPGKFSSVLAVPIVNCFSTKNLSENPFQASSAPVDPSPSKGRVRSDQSVPPKKESASAPPEPSVQTTTAQRPRGRSRNSHQKSDQISLQQPSQYSFTCFTALANPGNGQLKAKGDSFFSASEDLGVFWVASAFPEHQIVEGWKQLMGENRSAAVRRRRLSRLSCFEGDLPTEILKAAGGDLTLLSTVRLQFPEGAEAVLELTRHKPKNPCEVSQMITRSPGFKKWIQEHLKGLKDRGSRKKSGSKSVYNERVSSPLPNLTTRVPRETLRSSSAKKSLVRSPQKTSKIRSILKVVPKQETQQETKQEVKQEEAEKPERSARQQEIDKFMKRICDHYVEEGRKLLDRFREEMLSLPIPKLDA